MKRQSLVLIAVAIAGAGATGCFKDPVSNLKNGPAVMSVTNSAVFLRTGDSVTVTATLLDNAGDVTPLADSATWTTGDPSIALAHNDHSLTVPGDAYSRGVIVAVDSLTGGWTNVLVSARGLTDTIRVVVIPAKLTAQHVAFAGPTLTDTVIVPGNPLSPDTAAQHSTYTRYTGQDTLILNGTSLLKFDTSAVTVQINTTNGASKGLIVSKTPDQLGVVFQAGAAGKVMVQHLLLTPGNAQVGTIDVDTLISDSVAVAPWRIGPAEFGATAVLASNVVTVTAGTGMAFGSTTTAGFGGTPAILTGRTATTLTLLSPATFSGAVTVYHIRMAVTGPGVDSVTFDSLSSNSGAFSVTAVNLPDANVNLGGGLLGDTITITAPTGISFTTSGATPSRAFVGNQGQAGDTLWTSDTAWVLSMSASTMQVMARRGGSSFLKVTNLGLATPPPGALLFSLQTPDSMAIDSTASGIVGGTSKATALVTLIPASNVDTTYGYTWCPDADYSGSCYGTTAVLGFTTFTLAATQTIHAELDWFGSGNPGGSAPSSPSYTTDLDAQICNAAQACDESQGDLNGGSMESGKQPEVGTTTSALAPGQYWVGVIPWNGPYAVIYRLILTAQ